MSTSNEVREALKEIVVALVLDELEHAQGLYPQHQTLEHSAFVIMEEWDELRDELYKNPTSRRALNMVIEAKQLGAMALRFLHDGHMRGDFDIETLRRAFRLRDNKPENAPEYKKKAVDLLGGWR